MRYAMTPPKMPGKYFGGEQSSGGRIPHVDSRGKGNAEKTRRGGLRTYFIFSAAGMLPAVGAPLRTVAKVSISK